MSHLFHRTPDIEEIVYAAHPGLQSRITTAPNRPPRRAAGACLAAAPPVAG
jgi:hypothetical protein